ncbi:MAG TPA: DNA-formamidopyrimidine glycosylase family protein, partial [Terriglobales bacterium]
MPELPEVETIARGLHKRVAGDTIESVWLGEKPEPLKSPAKEIVEVLEGSRIVAVRRVGKHIVFDLDRSGRRKRKPVQHGQWIVHLGMTGRMQVTTPDAELARHTHAVAKLASGREVRFVDPRRFGRLAVVRMDSDRNATGFAAPGD